MMSGKFASNTSVSTESSRMEIERTLRRYGATDMGFMMGQQGAVFMFKLQGRMVRFVMQMPDPNSKEFQRTPGGRKVLGPDGRMKAWEQACRQKWRALALAIKAKLEAVESGITCFEDEFMAHIVLPDNRTVAEHVPPGIAAAYQTGKMPPLLLEMRP
jgi:hypothetical protein